MNEWHAAVDHLVCVPRDVIGAGAHQYVVRTSAARVCVKVNERATGSRERARQYTESVLDSSELAE